MRLLGFHHLAIQVHSLENVSAFYRDVLGLPEQARLTRPDGTLRSIWLTIPGGFLALEAVDASPEPTPFRHPRTGHHLLALRIARSDRAEIRRTLEENGIPIEHESGWTLYVRDPEGNRIGLSHHPEAAD
jgi:catechol 2,3-dioxygenase-like lactoylglutathione lyase family enzyme